MQFKCIEIPKTDYDKGTYGILENGTLPFEIKRVYYLHDIPSNSRRGGHAHKQQLEFLIPVAGSFDVILKNNKNKETIHLNRPDIGLLIGINTWRELENFSAGAVCLVLSSAEYDEEDYIRNYKEFLKYIKEVSF